MAECAYLKTHIREVSHHENGNNMIVVPESRRLREQIMVQKVLPKDFVCLWQGRYCALHTNLPSQKVP
ncbi:hypothetical protein TH2_03015 [Thalassospira profundimaris WP0211]|nr:hypothetical protein TH2_03015 [Thalassospira profundimaris WP0211]